MAEPCTTCKFFGGNSFFGLISPKCLNPQCVDKGFSHHDAVTGKTRHWPDAPMPCYKARWSPCGPDGRLWEKCN